MSHNPDTKLDQLEQELGMAQGLIQKMAALLLDIEDASYGCGGYCPACANDEDAGHNPHCLLMELTTEATDYRKEDK